MRILELGKFYPPKRIDDPAFGDEAARVTQPRLGRLHAFEVERKLPVEVRAFAEVEAHQPPTAEYTEGVVDGPSVQAVLRR